MGAKAQARKDARQDRRIERQDARAARKVALKEVSPVAKLAEMRTANVASKDERKMTKAALKAQTKQVAYANGIDPNASMWQGIAGTAQAASNVAGIFGGGGGGFMAGITGKSGSASMSGSVIMPVVLIGCGLLVLVMLLKKRK